MIDFNMALYSHCEDPGLGTHLGTFTKQLLDCVMEHVIGAPFEVTRLCTYLQGSVTFLDEDAEFRIHVWFELPESHPTYEQANRGLFCLVQPISPSGLYGPIQGQVSWLGEALTEQYMKPSPVDWVGTMILEQGYISIEGAEWEKAIDERVYLQVTSAFLSRHLRGMVSRRILEAEIEP